MERFKKSFLAYFSSKVSSFSMCAEFSKKVGQT